MQKILSNKSPFLVGIGALAGLVLSLSLAVVLTQQTTDTRSRATAENPRCIRPVPYENCRKFDPVNDQLADRPLYLLIGDTSNLYQDSACTQPISDFASYCGFVDLACSQYGGTCKQTCVPGELNLTEFVPQLQCYNNNNCCLRILNIPTPTLTPTPTPTPIPPAATNTPTLPPQPGQPTNTPTPTPSEPTISPIQSCRADFNGDGIYNGDDAIIIKRAANSHACLDDSPDTVCRVDLNGDLVYDGDDAIIIKRAANSESCLDTGRE